MKKKDPEAVLMGCKRGTVSKKRLYASIAFLDFLPPIGRMNLAKDFDWYDSKSSFKVLLDKYSNYSLGRKLG